LLEVPRQRLVPEQIDPGVLIPRVPYGSVGGDAWRLSHPVLTHSFDPVWLVGGRSLDHLCSALDGSERVQPVSVHALKARVSIIMANSATEMIFTPRWYTVAQVAQLLNYGESKVRMLIITGQLRSIKDGRSRRILPEWVEAYVQDRARSSEDIW
jgi:excisionase family DNA binding protein